MHGQVDDPEAVLRNHLGEGSEVLTIATGVVSVGSLEGPATIGLCLDLKGLIGSLALTVAGKCSGSGCGKVLAAVPVMAGQMRNWHNKSRVKQANVRMKTLPEASCSRKKICFFLMTLELALMRFPKVSAVR